MSRICRVEDCQKLSRFSGYCQSHYNRHRKYGDAEHELPGTAIRERFKAAIAAGEVDELLVSFHSADIAEFYEISHTTFKHWYPKKFSDIGKERRSVLDKSGFRRARVFALYGDWTLAASAEVFGAA